MIATQSASSAEPGAGAISALPAGRGVRVGAAQSNDDGFVLISVVAALLLLAVITATVMSSTRTQLRIRASLNTQAELSALADGMVRLFALRLSERPSAGTSTSSLLVDGTPMVCRDGDVVVDVRITDTAGLVDLNASPQDNFELLLRGLGQPRLDAARIAAAIQDFRDADSIAVGGGQEDQAYRAAGRKYGAKNSSFDSVDELDQVLGMTPEILQALRPLVTVHSRAPGLDPTVAPIALLEVLSRAVSGVSAPAISGGLRRDQFQLPPQFVMRANPRVLSRSRVRAYAVDVTTARRDGAMFHRAAVIELSNQADYGFVVREWSSRPGPIARTERRLETLSRCAAFQ